MEHMGLAVWGGLALGAAAIGTVYLLYHWIQYRNSQDRTFTQDHDSVSEKDVGESENMDVTNLQTSMLASSDAVLLTDGKWQLRWANDTACKWFGLDLSHHMDTPVNQVMDIPGLDLFLSRKNYSESFECIAPADSSIRLGIRVAPYRSGQYLLQGRDITKLHQLEQIRRDFVSNASHELRTPLSILYGYLEMMQDEPNDSISPQWKPAVQQMFEQTSRIKQIIDDMMFLSRLEDVDATLEQQHVAIAPIMHNAYKDAKALSSPKNQNVICEIDENYTLFCNINEIQSLINNLISNAVRYTQEGGNILIKWEVDLSGGKLSVEDTGIGIEEENIPRLTERFYRTDSARSRAAGGTGLGLAIVNHIVNRHNAQLLINSKVGKGSIFMVRFPSESIHADHDQVKLLLN